MNAMLYLHDTPTHLKERIEKKISDGSVDAVSCH